MRIQALKFFCLLVCYFIIHVGTITAQASHLFINEFMASNQQTLADEAGDFDDWIEIYNNGEDTAQVKGFFLTDNFNVPSKWELPDTAIPPNGFLIVWADAEMGQGTLHTNFKLDASGEQLGIFDGSIFIDSLSFGQQKTDVSYGRYPDGTNDWYSYTAPTPGTSNSLPSGQIMANPLFYPPGGFFHNSVSVAIELTSALPTIHYTLDYSDPTENSPVYSKPINLSRTTVIRAKAFAAGYLPSEVITHTYIISEDFDIATLSLVTDPANLWDTDIGIYVNPKESGDAWERPIDVELFLPNNQSCFSTNAGIRISGEVSREYKKKSFRLYFRSSYGINELEGPLFPAKILVSRFKRLSVHSGSTDMPVNPYSYGWTLLRDPLMYELGRRMGCIYPANRPVAVWLNGEPWGIYNLMERIDKYFTESNFGELDVDLIENNSGAREGDMAEWNNMISFFENHDLSDESNYVQAQSIIDIENYTSYNILEILGGNGDWTHHNVFAYRPRKTGAIWRWILWDMDGCFGPYGVYHNTVKFATRDDPATLILRKLLENSNYRNLFINRFADLLNTTLADAQVNYLIDSLANIIRNDISFETDKWGSSPTSWQEDGIDGELRDFAQRRPAIVRSHLQEQFKLEGKVKLTIEAPRAGDGSIRINSIRVDSFPWEGIYFNNLPIELEAIPAPSYVFKHWSDATLPPVSKISIVLTNDMNIAAEFEPGLPNVYLIINEINYHSAPAFDAGDWIELYNPSSDTVYLDSWCFKDDDDTHQFFFPANTKIAPAGYLVLCQNGAAFHSHFPDVINYMGNFDFGLSADGDNVRIFDPASNLIDSVGYDDDPPWPTFPDGNGPTLELIDPALNNSLATNWQASKGYGTPGKQNSPSGSFYFPEPERSEILPKSVLFQNFPNPFNSRTQIEYHLSTPAQVRITVYNLLGEIIATIENQYHSPGNYLVYWEGNDRQGQAIPSGIYLYKMNAGNFSQIRKMIIAR